MVSLKYLCVTNPNTMDKTLAKANAEIKLLQQQLRETTEANQRQLSLLERNLQEVQEFAGVGWWSIDMLSKKLSWSKEIFRQYDWDTHASAPTLEEFFRMVHPEDEPVLQESLKQAYREGHTLFEIRIIISENNIRYIRGTAKPLSNEKGEVIGLYGTSLDVTEIREAEIALRLEKEKYQLITENVRDLICMHHTDGKINYLSPSVYQILGYQPEELLGMYPYELLHPDDVKRVKVGPYTAVIRGENVDGTEYRLRRRDGRYIWLQAIITPVVIDGKVVSVQSVSRDITQQKIAQEKIKASERNYRRLAANIPGTDVYLFDLDKNLLITEGASMRKHGFDSRHFEGRKLEEVLDEGTVSILQPLYDAALQGESVSSDVLYAGRHYSLRSVPLRDDQGCIEGGLLVSADISERKRAEETLIKTKEELEEAQELARLGNWELEIESGALTLSPQFRKLFNLPNDYNPKLNQGLNFFTKKSKIEFQDAIRRTMKQGEHFDIKLQVYTGSYDRIWVRAMGKAITRNRQPYKIRGVFQDITREQTAELNIRHFQQGLKTLSMVASRSNLEFDEQIKRALQEVSAYLKMPMAIVSKIENGTCEILHAIRSEVGLPDMADQKVPLEHTYCELPYKEENVVAIAKVSKSAYADHNCYRSFGMESYIGSPVWVDGQLYGTVSFSSLQLRSSFSEEEKEFVKMLSRWVGATMERSIKEQELIQAKKQAEHASMAKAQFLSTMSHEIRTPLNAVIGITHLLLQDDPKPDQVENLNALRFSGENLLALINDILDFSKIEAGKIEFEEADFSLDEQMTGLRQSFGFKAREKGLEFNVCESSDIPATLVGDPTRLSQILNNLLSNAIKFTETGKVSLKVAVKKQTQKTVDLYFEVKDSGIGVPKDKLGAIFESFSQASTDTSRKFGGTGLGLTITKKLLELQGSKIKVKSKTGQGATFYFTLRFKIGQAKLVGRDSVFHQSGTDFESLEGYKVLLVEDNAMNVIVARQFLNRWKLDFDHAKDGEEAVRKVVDGAYDLVLMDLQMPVMDGYEATLLIRQTHPNLPIIALTASAMLEIQEQVYKVGMNDFVTKPFNPRDLYQKIVRYLYKTNVRL